MEYKMMTPSSDLESGSPTLASLSQFTRTTLVRRVKYLVVIALILCLIVFGSVRTTFDYGNGTAQDKYDIPDWITASQPYDVMGVEVPDWVKALPPDDPTKNELSPGSMILSEVVVTNLSPPIYHTFPQHLLSELYHTASPSRPKSIPKDSPTDLWVNTWTSPVWYKKAATHNEGERNMPRIQYAFEGIQEGEEEKLVREERKEAVKRGFVYAWQKYKQYAWGHDEVRPVTKIPSNPFQNWGASIIDSLETLLIMDLSPEYDICRPHVNQLDLHLINGKDWARGKRIFAKDGSVAYEEKEGRDTTATVATFETGIRYLGGLIGAYDLSGDQLMLDRAEDLGRLLGRGFDTPSGLLMAKVDAGSDVPFFEIGRVSLAEVGSMTLELTRLSQITGNQWYFDRAQRAIDYIQTQIIPLSKLPPLIPTMFNGMAGSHPNLLTGSFSFGGMADSYYEYLIKQHQLIGGATDQYKDMYIAAIEAAQEHLYRDVEILGGSRDLVTIGASSQGKPASELEHLTCFAGAMLGLGAKLLNRPADLEYGKKLTQTCYWLGASTPSGCQPERVIWFDAADPSAFQNHTILKSGAKSDQKFLRGIPPGTKWLDKRYLGRPETIESVFYMYRLTGDKKWQDKGWRMFVSWTKAAVVSGGYSSLVDVRQEHPQHGDNMESFVFAETFKYHYLLQAEPDLISLDDYVFTTEAHPLIARPGLKAGSQGFWRRPDDADEGLGHRGRGTDAQLSTRYDLVQREAAAPPRKVFNGRPLPPMRNSPGDPPAMVNKNPVLQD